VLSLRARLLLGLAVLVAAGLAAAGAITYASQRSFLLGRVDQEVVSAAVPISDHFGVALAGTYGAQPTGTGAANGSVAQQTAAGLFGQNGEGNGLPGAGEGLGGPAPRAFQPNGTWGEQLNAKGKLVGQPLSYSYAGEQSAAAPRLPPHFPVSASLADPHLFSVDSVGGSSLRYRVLALRSAGGGTTIVAVPLSAADQTLARLSRDEALIAGAVLLALLLLAWGVIQVGLRPLARMGRVAGQIAAGDLGRRVSPENPRTEVGRLGLALNGMLMTIEQAFADRRASEERLRRFLSDASHELRTPLASIRGYAELFRLGAASDPEDLARAMARIEAESARMGVLVEDLLMLARLDEMPQKRMARVDMRQLAEHAAADARAAAPDRAIAVAGGSPLAVHGDPDQLHQVLANLVRNAITHTPAGSGVEIDLRREGSRVIVEVRDHGAGLPEEIRERIFDRFWRLEPGRTRGQGGSGLGLAIVQAIVRTHHGDVHAENAIDGGAVFRVSLPAEDAIADASEVPDDEGQIEGSQRNLSGAAG
jgi:two-component system OmpR family sensor kinase